MRSPRNRIKLTGDTHLPDAGMDYSKDDEPDLLLVEDVRVYADGYVPQAPTQTMVVALVPEEELGPGMDAGRAGALERAAGRLEAGKLWLALGLGLAGGFMLMHMLRHALRR